MAPTVYNVYVCRHLGPAAEAEKVSPEGPGRLPRDTNVHAGAECRPGWRWGSPGPRPQSRHTEHRDHVTASLEALCDPRVALSVATVGMSPSPPGRPQHPPFAPSSALPRQPAVPGRRPQLASPGVPALMTARPPRVELTRATS